MTTLTKKTEKLFPTFFTDFFDTDVFPFGNLWDKSITKMSPSVNIKETNDAFHLEVAAPGLKKEDFKIEVNDGVLTISAEKKEEKKEENEKYNRREFYYNSFSRSFSLPTNVSDSAIKATYENGLLVIDIPKVTKTETSKTISIQ